MIKNKIKLIALASLSGFFFLTTVFVTVVLLVYSRAIIKEKAWPAWSSKSKNVSTWEINMTEKLASMSSTCAKQLFNDQAPESMDYLKLVMKMDSCRLQNLTITAQRKGLEVQEDSFLFLRFLAILLDMEVLLINFDTTGVLNYYIPVTAYGVEVELPKLHEYYSHYKTCSSLARDDSSDDLPLAAFTRMLMNCLDDKITLNRMKSGVGRMTKVVIADYGEGLRTWMPEWLSKAK